MARKEKESPMDIEILTGTLEAVENPGLETFDPRLGDITTLVQDGKYEAAAAEADAVIQDGVYDIRVIGFSLYGYFLENGIAALSPIFDAFTALLTDNLEAVGPAKKREKHYQTSLKWFVNQLDKKIKYEEDKQSPVYNAWVENISSDDVQAVLDASEKFQRAMGMTLEDLAGDITEPLTKVKGWLSGFQKLVYKEPEPEPEPEAEPEETEDAAEEKKPQTGGFRFAFSGGEGVGAEGSYHLQVLIQKLAAFEQLIKAEKFELASLVADDINEIVANFDPKVYFPKIFAGFSFLFARHISQLLSFDQHKGTVEWAALQELYKVDLASFVNFDGDIEFSTGMDMGASPDEYAGAEPEDADIYDETPAYDEDEDLYD